MMTHVISLQSSTQGTITLTLPPQVLAGKPYEPAVRINSADPGTRVVVELVLVQGPPNVTMSPTARTAVVLIANDGKGIGQFEYVQFSGQGFASVHAAAVNLVAGVHALEVVQ